MVVVTCFISSSAIDLSAPISLDKELDALRLIIGNYPPFDPVFLSLSVSFLDEKR